MAVFGTRIVAALAGAIATMSPASNARTLVPAIIVFFTSFPLEIWRCSAGRWQHSVHRTFEAILCGYWGYSQW